MPKESKMQIIPLGGLGEIGKNTTAIRYNDQILIIDGGLAFPDEDMYGVDLVIPDYTYLIENKDLILGILITHGHEDHIGGLPYLLRHLNVPIFGTRLAIGLVQYKLTEAKLGQVTTQVIQPGETIKLGSFAVDFINGSHSIPGSVGLALHSPLGTIVHSGDFKLDHTPVSGEVLDIHKFSELGDKGVLCLLSDSTNVERPGFTKSERLVGQNIDKAFADAEGRVIFASFASNVNRLQQAITAAFKYQRKVAAVGRSMVNVVSIAAELGYLDVPKDTLIDVDEAMLLPSNQVCILTTGSQGEPMAALTRMANHNHRQISIYPGDTVILSASPIPGNEKAVSRNIDQLFKLGAKVIYESISGMHVSGHASQEELKLMLSMIKPKYFIPVHGEYRMLMKHAELAAQVGIPRGNIFVAEIGNVIEFTRHGAKLANNVTAGRVFIDGLGIGDIGSSVMKERSLLSQDGILIIILALNSATNTILAGPDVVTRGFVYVRESNVILDEVKAITRETIAGSLQNGIHETNLLQNRVRDAVSRHLYTKTKRRPMVIPIFQEV
ncbi:ribonuclease J [Desulfosporosinus sp.]|uniref:ribonuclease J n=1 Tax=Desulfosporosinus sp. TaxID=157907 RepID=UPI0025C32355|nr:ribonuclease J [Desulfosporosinus sp.]MBC2724231.1 ribonuclease J [Desulfosporosinus sp.]MBC2725875.1 ribonuclease J [Desulfosporosinus sp.]